MNARTILSPARAVARRPYHLATHAASIPPSAAARPLSTVATPSCWARRSNILDSPARRSIHSSSLLLQHSQTTTHSGKKGPANDRPPPAKPAGQQAAARSPLAKSVKPPAGTPQKQAPARPAAAAAATPGSKLTAGQGKAAQPAAPAATTAPKGEAASPAKDAATPPTTTTTPAGEVQPPTEQKSLMAKVKELWATAKSLFKFYFNGVKQIWANRNRVAELKARVAAGGAALTREETQLIRVHAADMRKLPLFMAILLIFEEILPLVVIWAPGLLPSTCILPNQLLKIRMKEEVTRAAACDKLKEDDAVKALLPVVTGSGPTLQLAEAHRGGADGGSDILASLKGETLTQLAKVFSLPTWGGAAMTRRRLVDHLKYLRDDDAMMCEGGGYQSIPQHADAVAKACGERGLRATDLSQREMYDSLRTWLLYTTRHEATAQQMSMDSLALLPLQLYKSGSMQQIEASLEAENGRGLIEKTKDVLNEVVQEVEKEQVRDQKSEEEVKAKELEKGSEPNKKR